MGYSQNGYKLELDACVHNDTLFVDFMATDTLSAVPTWAFGSSNFVVDIVSPTGGPGTGLAGLDFANKTLTYRGPWSAAQNAPFYQTMSLGAVDTFLNVTVVDDEVNNPGTGHLLVPDSTYIIATVAIPLNGTSCGDTIGFKWRYRARGPDHNWTGKSAGFGSGDINQWGEHTCLLYTSPSPRDA